MDGSTQGGGDSVIQAASHERHRPRDTMGELGMYLLFFTASFSMSMFLIARQNGGTSDDTGYPVVDPQSCGSEVERVLNVFSWASTQGAFLHPNLSTGLFPIPGDDSGFLVRGIKAKGVVKQDSVIFALPPSMLLNIATVVRNDPFWLLKYENITMMRDGVAGLAVWLLRESAMLDSRWRPYICSLPRHVPLPLFYSPQKLAKVRETLPEDQLETFDSLMEVRRDSFEVKYMQLVPQLLRYFPGDFSAAEYSYERFVWAASIILSRSWGRGVKDDDHPALRNISDALGGGNEDKNATNVMMRNVHTLAPAADMPNHCDEGHQAAKAPDGSLILRAATDIEDGGQILISYGQKCDAEVLATYGFVPFNNSRVVCHKESLPASGEVKAMQLAWRKTWREHFGEMYAAIRHQAQLSMRLRSV